MLHSATTWGASEYIFSHLVRIMLPHHDLSSVSRAFRMENRSRAQNSLNDLKIRVSRDHMSSFFAKWRHNDVIAYQWWIEFLFFLMFYILGMHKFLFYQFHLVSLESKELLESYHKELLDLIHSPHSFF